jgi:hypothetical protein
MTHSTRIAGYLSQFAARPLLAIPLAAIPAHAAEPESGSGYLVASIATGNDPTISLFLGFVSDDKETNGKVERMSLSLAPNDFEDPSGERGSVYAKALPPGTYRFRRLAENDGKELSSIPGALPALPPHAAALIGMRLEAAGALADFCARCGRCDEEKILK